MGDYCSADDIRPSLYIDAYARIRTWTTVYICSVNLLPYLECEIRYGGHKTELHIVVSTFSSCKNTRKWPLKLSPTVAGDVWHSF